MKTITQTFLILVLFFLHILLLRMVNEHMGTTYTIVAAIYAYDHLYIGSIENEVNKTVSTAIFWITLLLIPVTFHAIKTFS